MAHVALDSLLPSLRIQLPGIPEPVLRDATIRVTRQFYWKSESWKYTVTSLLDWTTALTFPALDAGVELPAQTTLKRVDTVRYGSDGTSLKTVVFLTKDQLDRQNSDWEAETGNNPQSWTYENQAARIIPIATDDVLTSLKIRAIIAPDVTTIGSNVIPDLLFHEHEEWLKAGVWAQLMAQAGKDWSQPAQAVKYERMFEFGIKQAKSRSEADFGQPDRESAYGGIPV